MAEAGYPPNTCILQGRVAIEALKYFDIEAAAIPCLANIFNAPLWAQMESDHPPETAEDFIALEPDGSWGVSVGTGDDRPGLWADHLLVGSNRHRWLADPSIGQVSLPDHDILLAPAIVAMSDDLYPGDGFSIKEPSGCVIKYVITSNLLYQEALAWRDRSLWSPLVGRVMHRIKETWDCSCAASVQ